MVSLGRVPSLVVTLATLYIIRGIDILIVGGNEVVAQSLPGSFLNIPQDTVLGVPDVAIAVAVSSPWVPITAVVPVRPGAVRDRLEPGRGRLAG